MSEVKYGTVWNDADLRKAIAQAPQTYARTMGAALAMMLSETRTELVKNSPGRQGGEGNLASSWQVIALGQLSGAVRAGVPYAYWADQGRGPGKMPPYDPIEQWVHRMGLGKRATGQEREERRPEHVETEPRKVQARRRARTERVAKGERRELDRESIIYLIRRKIGARGTFTPNPPPKFVDKSRAIMEPRLQQRYQDAVDAFVAAVSTNP